MLSDVGDSFDGARRLETNLGRSPRRCAWPGTRLVPIEAQKSNVDHLLTPPGDASEVFIYEGLSVIMAGEVRGVERELQ